MSTDSEPLLLPVSKAAKKLGVSESTARQLIKDHGLPTLRWFSQLWVPVHALEEWVKAQTPDEAA